MLNAHEQKLFKDDDGEIQIAQKEYRRPFLNNVDTFHLQEKFVKLSAITGDDTNAATEADQGKKRLAPVAPSVQTKTSSAIHQSSEKQTASVTLKASTQPKFVKASEIARANFRVMVEISDEESLEMTIRLEKKHPQ
ncbi:hypothetical protein I4U23_005718 [Adineta vaga]|nr:hypothetical protein I4U23_005718 [Adineta vaga]